MQHLKFKDMKVYIGMRLCSGKPKHTQLIIIILLHTYTHNISCISLVERIFNGQAPGVSLKAAQFSPRLGAVPLKVLISTDTEEPVLISYELQRSCTIGVSWREREEGRKGERDRERERERGREREINCAMRRNCRKYYESLPR